MTEEDGKLAIDASVNGVGIKTFYTEENWFVSMSSNTYLFLSENGYIKNDEVKGITTVKMPDGSSVKAAAFVIRELKVGDGIIVKDIPAFVIKKQTVPMLIGSSAFESLGEVTREGNKIIVSDMNPKTPEKEVQDPLDSLNLAAETFLESKEYSEAASCFKALDEKGALNMLSQYQYAMVLDLLGKDADNIDVSARWLDSYKGKSLTMDFWICNGLGKAYARTGDNAKSIDSFEKAIATYYSLFNTSEKEVRKGSFHDQTLGATLFSLGKVYASEGKVAKCEINCSMGAKCGYSPAAEFCEEYHIKY